MNGENLRDKSFSGYIPVFGSRIPLDSGEWTILGDFRNSNDSRLFIAYFLAHIEEDILRGAVRIMAQIDTGEGPYDKLNFLDNALYHVEEKNEPNGSQAAWTIINILKSHWRTPYDENIKFNHAEREAAVYMNKQKIKFSNENLVAQFVRREKGKFIQFSQYFSPDLDGIAVTHKAPKHWKDSDFSFTNIRRHPLNFKYLTSIIDRSENWWLRFQASFEENYLEGY